MKNIFICGAGAIAAAVSLLVVLTSLSVSASDTEYDEYILASYIEGAAGGESLAVMISVGDVLVNRAASEKFSPSVTSNGASLMIMPKKPSEMALFAASLSLSGVDLTDGATNFYFSENHSLIDGSATFEIGGFVFAK
ncbi:MAG: cell wall hydrolase [Firmicutes bacterium]|nr:cell wall hydrolase [Bacillota bacterium]